MRIAIAQINTTTGDIAGNCARIVAGWRRAKAEGADLFVAPELAVIGYPPRDLLLRDGVVRAVEKATEALALEGAGGPPAVVGTVVRNCSETGPALCNAAAFLRDGRIERVYVKRLLPTYDVFDERRYFAPGDETVVVEVAGKRVGLLICEDLWGADPIDGRKLYDADPPGDLMKAGLDVAIGISASPYHGGKDSHRRDLFAAEACRMGVPLVSAHQVGGNDDVLFDGRSRVFDARGQVVSCLAAFEEDFEVVDLAATEPMTLTDPPGEAEETRRALVMGLRDYGSKVGMTTGLVGLSGGVDSAVVACLAADAFGAKNVLGVSMPGPFTSDASKIDARGLAENLGMDLMEISIQKPYEAALSALGPVFEGRAFDVTEENLQARMRGTYLMALSNKFGHLVLSTGNKSEVAVGYCTLYGDMNGGLAVLSDVWKMMVYAIARGYVDRGVIPERTVTRPPSAELAPDQTDQDSLPPYDVLDRILESRIERGASLSEIVATGEDAAVVERVLRMVERNEYKRRQMAPGLKVTPTAFGVGWRMPIARPVDLSGEL